MARTDSERTVGACWITSRSGGRCRCCCGLLHARLCCLGSTGGEERDASRGRGRRPLRARRVSPALGGPARRPRGTSDTSGFDRSLPGGCGRGPRGSAGGRCGTSPHPRVWPEYHPGYYGVFLRDLDGNNVEAVHHIRGQLRPVSLLVGAPRILGRPGLAGGPFPHPTRIADDRGVVRGNPEPASEIVSSLHARHPTPGPLAVVRHQTTVVSVTVVRGSTKTSAAARCAARR